MKNIDHKNPERVAAGLKAVLHNPNTTTQARAHAHERLTAMGVETEPLADKDTGAKADTKAHEHHVLGGYKATLKNPNVSEAAKLHAEEVLHEHGE